MLIISITQIIDKLAVGYALDAAAAVPCRAVHIQLHIGGRLVGFWAATGTGTLVSAEHLIADAVDFGRHDRPEHLDGLRLAANALAFFKISISRA